MSLFDTILRSISGAPDDVANLAAKVGIPPELAERAIQALGRAHQQPGDTLAGAAAATGLDRGVLARIVEEIGGEGSLTRFAAMLDRDGDGNPLNEIRGMAGRLFGRN